MTEQEEMHNDMQKRIAAATAEITAVLAKHSLGMMPTFQFVDEKQPPKSVLE